MSIVHDIYASFDPDPTLEVRANFLDMSVDQLDKDLRKIQNCSHNPDLSKQA